MTEQEARAALVVVLRTRVRQHKEAQAALTIAQGIADVGTDFVLAIAHVMADLGAMVQRGLLALGKERNQ